MSCSPENPSPAKAKRPPKRSPREVAVDIVRTLRDAGFDALLAGGCVRDELLGLSPKDYDVATSATPDQVQAVFPKARGVGKAFGVMLVRQGKIVTEVATFREEWGYEDNRRPEHIRFTDAKGDAKRRDFTINALYIDPLDEADRAGGCIIDHVEGQADLHAKRIRAVGQAAERLAEDHLRALRAVRFAARLGFSIEGATAEAITEHASQLAGVSRERIGDEVRKMLAHPGRANAVQMLRSLELEGPVLNTNQIELTQGPRTLALVKGLPAAADVPTTLVAWLLDVFPPEASGSGSGSGFGFGLTSTQAAQAAVPHWRKAMCLSNEETNLTNAILAQHAFLQSDWAAVGTAQRKRAIAGAGFAGALELVSAADEQAAGAIAHAVRLLADDGIGISPTPLVTGDDLVRAQLQPSPVFKVALARAYDAQLEGTITTAPQALALAKKIASEQPKPSSH